jgi:aromatic-L-amino-acid decarboxylase
LAAVIREHVRLAAELARRVDAHPNLERLAPAHLSVVCFRVVPEGVHDEAEIERVNAAVLERVNASGEVFISHTKLKGRYCLRVAVGHAGTTPARVERVLALVCAAAGIDPAPRGVE